MIGQTARGARRRAVLAASLLLLTPGAVAGCAQEADTLDRAGTERAVERVIGGRIGPAVDRVRCPADIARGDGERVTCRALLVEGDLEVRLGVSQTDDDGTLEVALLDAVIDRAEVAEDLHGTLVETYRRAFEVDCGDGTDVVAPDATFTCTADDAAGARQVTVTVTDTAGTLAYDVGAS